MTREENIAKMAELRSEVEALTVAYNDAIQNGKFEDATKADAATADKINEYTSIARGICFDDCKATEDPMLTAVTKLTYMTICVKDEKQGEDKIPTRKVDDREKPIDLLKLDKHCGGIGAEKNWAHTAMKMNFLMTAQKCIDLGIDPQAVNDSYSMSAIAKQIDMGKTPTSKTNMLKTLQTVVSAMIGEGYKATSHDVNYLVSIYAKKNRTALSVTCANHKYFRQYMAEICHRIVTDKAYSVEFKTTKK